MNTLEFLQRVLPAEGFYVTTVINEDGNRQGFYKTVKELAKVSEALDKRNNNTYFAIQHLVRRVVEDRIMLEPLKL